MYLNARIIIDYFSERFPCCVTLIVTFFILGELNTRDMVFEQLKDPPPLAPCTSHSNSISKVEQINMTMVVFNDTSLESLFIATSIHAIKT